MIDDILRVINNYYLTSVTLSGNIDMVGNDLLNVDKLTVNTIDPEYIINGKKYANYVTDYAGGVRVETSGIVKLSSHQPSAISNYLIDFEDLETGSDLWLFWQTIHQDLDQVIVLLTPAFNGRVWYKKLGDSKLIIYANRVGEVSYRLNAPREDYQKWPNLISQK